MDKLVFDHIAERVTFAFWFDVLFAAGTPPRLGKVVRRRRRGVTVFCIPPRIARPIPTREPERYDSLTRDVEAELIRAYHEDGDLDALDRLVGAHRPMVVRLARRFARGDLRKLKIFVEYGLLGLMEAAAPPRPSLTKKGQLVGFDPSKFRFSAYSRQFAEKMMRRATPDST